MGWGGVGGGGCCCVYILSCCPPIKSGLMSLLLRRSTLWVTIWKLEGLFVFWFFYKKRGSQRSRNKTKNKCKLAHQLDDLDFSCSSYQVVSQSSICFTVQSFCSRFISQTFNLSKKKCKGLKIFSFISPVLSCFVSARSDCSMRPGALGELQKDNEK